MTDATTRRASSLDEKRLVTTYHPEGTSVRSVSSTADRACGFLPSIGQRTTRSRKFVGCRLARPANGPRAPLQERPERWIKFERGDRERTETGIPGQDAGRKRREERAGTRSRVQHSHGLAIRFAHRSHKPRHPHRREILAQGDLALGNESGPGGPSDHGPLGEEAISDFGRCVGDPEPGRTVVSGRDAPIDGAAGRDRRHSRVRGGGPCPSMGSCCRRAWVAIWGLRGDAGSQKLSCSAFVRKASGPTTIGSRWRG